MTTEDYLDDPRLYTVERLLMAAAAAGVANPTRPYTLGGLRRAACELLADLDEVARTSGGVS